MAALEKGVQVLAALQKQSSMKEKKDDAVDWDAINDPTAKLRKWLPPLTEEEEANMLHMPIMENDVPVDENGDPMIMLPFFDEDDAVKPPTRSNETSKRSMVLTRSISRAEVNFGSKAWDALFNAAQLAQQEGTAEHKELEDFKREAQQRYLDKEEEIPMSSIYELLNETPEETKRRLKALRERNKRLATIHSSMRKNWMVKHGRVVRPELPKAMRLQLREAFDLIDQDGSGAIDVDELEEAFQVLGMDVTRRQVEAMMDEFDDDKSGEVELPEFEQIMAAQLAGADEVLNDGKESKNSGAGVPFHVMATSYRRKRLMDAIITSDYDCLRSLIEKAQQYKELADKERAQMISEHLWISVKVAQRIRRFIRNWRKVKEIRDRDKVKAAAEARQESYKQINLLEDGEEEFEEPHPQELPVKETSLRGERDMTAIKLTERHLDQRTMEKIRMRAKVSSIVAALDAKEKLELQAFAAPVRRPENYYEPEDLTGLKHSLDKMFVVAEKNKAALSKRMILAANAHRKLPRATRGMSEGPLVRPNEVMTGLQLTPRTRAYGVIERLSNGKGSKGPEATVAKLKSAAKRHNNQSRMSTTPQRINHVNFEEHPRDSREDLPPRASSCVPWLSEEKVGPSGNSEEQLHALLERGISTISEHNKVKTRPGLHSRLSEKAMDVLQDPSRTASAEVTADGSIPSNHIAASLDALESATGVLHQGPHATMRQHQTVRLHKRSKAPEPLPMVQHKHMLASATYTTNPYRRAHQAPLLSGGRTSPTPFSAHLSAQMPGRVLPLLNEVPKSTWRASTGSRSPGPGPSFGGSKAHSRVLATADSDIRPQNSNNSKSRHAKKHRGGPGNGVAMGLGRRSRAGDEIVSDIQPSYVLGQDERRRLGPGVARHFVEVMMDVPHTPQASRRPRWSYAAQDDTDIHSFPFEPRSPMMWGEGDL